MKDLKTYAEQTDHDFQDEGYFKNIVPEWLGQEEDTGEGGIMVPEQIQQTDEEIPPIEDTADVEELAQEQDAEPDDDCEDNEECDFAEDREEADPDEESEHYEAEDIYFDDTAYLMEEFQERFEDGSIDEEDWLIAQEYMEEAGCWARSDDAGWFYED